MSTTDHAFIKVYRQGARPAIAPRADFGVAESPVDSIVAMSAAIDPQLASFLRPVDAAEGRTSGSGLREIPPTPHIPSARQLQHGISSEVFSGGAPSVQPESKPTQAFDGSDRVAHLRYDAQHQRVPEPHIQVDRYQRGPAIQVLDMMSQTKTPADSRELQENLLVRQSTFSAGWEVDAFSWPSACNELQRVWIGPLTSVVRAVVRQAWEGGNVVAVTQSARGEGATTLALCLSRIAASFQLPVALVDGCTRQPGVAKALRLHFEHGWDQSSPELPLEEAAIRSIADELVVLPCSAANDGQLAGPMGPLRSSVFEQLHSAFELLVLDMGPMYTAAREWLTPDGARHIGCALVVRDVRHTELAQTEDVCHRLRQAGVKHISIIENFQAG